VAESLKRLEPVIARASVLGMPVRGYVSCVLGCPYEGDVEPVAVAEVAARLFSLGCGEISLGDTIGTGTPRATWRLLEVVAGRVPSDRLAVHFHDTYGQALANLLAALEVGISVVDSAVAGLGGCPYAAGASGNVATEDVVFMLDGMGIWTGVDLATLARAGWRILDHIGRAPTSRVSMALRKKMQESAVSEQRFRVW
jgi:isopropylmalate/homocitrate/citramalate synthase